MESYKLQDNLYVSKSKLDFYHGYITLWVYMKLTYFFEWVRGLLKCK